jgi:alkanesulfonate monooxygenase SsuD/methylene tetrahydromethanopterin reductase-like flavin-dependent oxidoreductase (luciferase family)
MAPLAGRSGQTRAERRIWAQLTPMPRDRLVAAVARYESAGLDGIWSPQTFGAPFLPLAAAAAVSETLKLGTGIALAFVRSPLETACNIMDLDLISGGRAVLGLGSSAESLSGGAFGMPYGKPMTHMREVIGLVRAIIAKGHTGELGLIEGEYHRLDLRNFRTLHPPVRTEIPVYMPAVFETACALAGELADGLLGHPIWNDRWIHEVTGFALKRGLDKTGRDRGAVTLNLQIFMAINADRRAAIEDARPTIAFYSQSPQYLRYFDAIGDIAGMVAACPDEMVESIALVGPPDEVLRRFRERTRDADACTPVIPHFGLDQDRLDFYTDAIADLLYQRGSG